MDSFYPIIILIFVAIVFWTLSKLLDSISDFKEKKRNAEVESSSVDKTAENAQLSRPVNEFDGLDNVELLKRILEKLSCQYHEDDKHGLWFTYQGDSFFVSASAESKWIRIYDLQWFDCPVDDIDRISCMRKAINYANERQSSTACYGVREKDKKFIVYSKCDILISSDIPRPDEYFATWLAQFFRLKQDVVLEYEKEKQKIGIVN